MFFQLFVLSIVLSVATAGDKCECDSCNIKGPAQNVDWKKMPTPWYMTLSLRDAITEDALCLVMVDLKETKKGVAYDVEDYRMDDQGDELVKGDLHWENIRQEDGTFRLDTSDVAAWEKELAHSKKERKDFEKEIKEHKKDAEYTFTDYENYLIFVMCNAEGEKLFVGYTAEPKPSNDVKQMIRDRLGKLGWGWKNLQFCESECSMIDTYPGYDKFADRFEIIED